MYQHHIQLKTAEPISKQQALAWYKSVHEFGPEDITFAYDHNGSTIDMEYGVCDDCEMTHTYIIPLKRDLTPTETAIILEAWDYVFKQDFDIEISNTYDDMGMGEYENSLDIDPETREQAVTDMNKWNHNRWFEQKVSEGWRWGSYFSSKNKTHPALRQWDDLPESHRRSRDIDDQEIFEWLKKNKII